jgi:hypothetical protein
MINDAIRIGLAENIKGRLKLRDRIYEEFEDRYRVVSVLPTPSLKWHGPYSRSTSTGGGSRMRRD